MCVQCMAGAATAMGGATGVRAWLATRTWITPKALRRWTIGLLGAGVVASATLVGSTAPAQVAAPPSAATAQGQPTR